MCTNDDKYLLDTIKTFNPLIKKYSKLLNYYEAETDLVFALVSILRRLPKTDNNAIIIAYITTSLRNEYIALSRKKQHQLKYEYLTDKLFILEKNQLDMELIMDIKNALSRLTLNQRRVIYYKYYLGYSDSEIASLLKISRQAVNKTKRTSLRRLGKLLG